jgi:integrase/recombinase XerD
VDPAAFQTACLEAYEASQVARGFSQTTMDNGAGALERFLAACGRPAWEVTCEDVDRVVAGLAGQGLAASTRRGYVQAFKSFHTFLVARKAAEIEAAFGVRLVDPVDEFNAARHVALDTPSAKPPPSVERMEEFFGFLKGRIATARKYVAAGRDYALFRTLYLAGLRAEEAASLDRSDVHFGAGPVRQASRPVRQRRQDLRAAAPVGADARRPRLDPALVSRPDPSPARGWPGVVL